MTEQEAQALAARLTRVWGIASHALEWHQDPCHVWGLGDDGYTFEGPINEEISLLYQPRDDLLRILSWSHDIVISNSRGTFSTRRYFASEHDVSSFAPFTTHCFLAQWMPLFRRGCWLSGCPIEASAHEKAEWMQGFSQEELEAWNLKI